VRLPRPLLPFSISKRHWIAFSCTTGAARPLLRAALTYSVLNFCLIFSLSGLLAGCLDAASSDNRTPVIVELFTSEGCSSCPPADQLLARLEKAQPVPEANIIVLGEHVDYWNQLGWQDRFAAHLYTERQQDYASSLGVEDVYTPQMVVNGKAEFNGADAQRAVKEIRRAAAAPHSSVSLLLKDPSNLALAVGHFPSGTKNVEILLAITEDSLASDVRKGENAGHRLTHAGVVRSMVSVARFDARKLPDFSSGLALRLQSDWDRQNLHAVVLVADRGTRRIIGAAKLKL
jgi:hypothetical protein